MWHYSSITKCCACHEKWHCNITTVIMAPVTKNETPTSPSSVPAYHEKRISWWIPVAYMKRDLHYRTVTSLKYSLTELLLDGTNIWQNYSLIELVLDCTATFLGYSLIELVPDWTGTWQNCCFTELFACLNLRNSEVSSPSHCCKLLRIGCFTVNYSRFWPETECPLYRRRWVRLAVSDEFWEQKIHP